MLKRAVVLMGLACLFMHCESKPSDVSDVLALMETRSVPALAYVLFFDGEVVEQDALGTTVLGGDVPVTASSRFHIGSNTKAMTALLAAIAVDRELIGWQSRVGELLEERIGEIPVEYTALTLEQLLSHTAGVPYAGGEDLWVGYFTADESAYDQRTRMVRDVMRLKLHFTPGEDYEYSNFGYIMAGAMLEEVFGADWETLMRREIFLPLGMENSGFGPPALGEARLQPWGHSSGPVDPEVPGADNPPGLGPAGTVYSSIDDLTAYVRMWLSGGVLPDGERLVSEENLDYLIRPHREDYALGWLSTVDSERGRIIQHDGSNTMFYAHFSLFPEEGTALVLLCNSGTEEAVRTVYDWRETLLK